ncbi:UDP-N-acetylmuramoyl-L-alanyl-D-glutamate--2,6-diaminopimelate ligase [Paenisporosarcina sp. TG20]|uniref:UDP-N-acetylmuramoyl-L-alanyl-D-glutamate--2, 6-diaminopimelate ligase n=1 Tax=Paenisporosarcina sp. TG20 TaxID=1211706 RepID=UPI0002E67261|nr:UDP-N-acetylmuramoyl-L-alanyl-D-glutamate--2,6-diaminopimelate ligase [Paenisporosarcina sp. TG20]
MQTSELFSCLPAKEIHGILPKEVFDIAVDSRSVQPESVFICIKGYTVDGHDYVFQAIESGARIIVSEKHLDLDYNRVACIVVADTTRAIGLLASKFYGYPSRDMKMIGVTGTNGKTSVSGILHNMLQGLNVKSALTGTIGFNLNGLIFDSANTTSDALSTQLMIQRAKNEGCTAMVMEVSSHGLVLGRLTGVDFDIAIFTNLTHDHLDFHGTMENYGQSKGLLFSQLGQDLERHKHAIVNADDSWSDRLKEMTGYPVWTYGINEVAHFQGQNIQLKSNCTQFEMKTPEGVFPVRMNLLGEFNVYNALAASAALYTQGFSIPQILQQLEKIPPIKGRMERLESELPISIYIDYAHTPDAIEKAISSVLPFKTNRLIFLVGTGGNRDRSKRPAMALKASVADYVILTTDDPRDEPYESILSDLEKGMLHENFALIGDRGMAVKHAIAIAEPGDIIIFAGKGHEDYQIIGHTKFPHSDGNIALSAGKLKFHDLPSRS